MLYDAALDLLLGEWCVGCERPGRLLCRRCADGLPTGAFAAWPVPPPSGLRAPWAAAPYDATVRQLALGLKERRLRALARPLSRLLAGAVATAVAAAYLDEPETASGPVVLVPVPSRRATVRSRGHDPTHAITAGAARLLRRRGLPVVVARPLRLHRRVRDQSGLSVAARAANLAGSMRCASWALRRVRRRHPGLLVVCDDVLTTGATAAEAQRVLAAAGLPVAALAVVAATPRRTPARTPVRTIGPDAVLHGENSADVLLSHGGTD